MSYRHFGDFISSLSNYSDRPALSIRPFLKIERLTFGELQLRAYQTAHFLAAQEIKQGDRVMIIAPNSPQWVELYLGTQLIGAILVPIDAISSLKTVRKFIEETSPKAIFKSNYLHPELDSNFKTYTLDQLEEFISTYPKVPPTNEIKDSSESLIVFTSGTTADPKGVVLTQENVLANITGVQQALDIDSNWRLLSVLPLSHMYELTGGCLAVLSKGASVYYLPRVTPLAIANALQDYQITTILAIPQLLILLLERIKQTAASEGKANTLALALKIASIVPFKMRRLLFASVHSRLGGHLELVVTGGAPIPMEVASAWESMGVKMVQGYGLTETSPILTVNSLSNRKLDSAGRALQNINLRIGKDNEIQAKGPSIFKGYWHNTEATKAAFTEDGWFRTGDVGRLDNGWLRVQGRLKFAIVLNSGLKVFPEDIELVADQYSIFREFCAVGVNRANGEKVMAVIISHKSDQEVNRAIADINTNLESYQHIDEWRRWPDKDFPRTRLLKIDRRQVQQWANSNGFEKQAISETKLPGEDSIPNIIRLSLGEAKIQINETDRLADLGLDSLRRLNLVSLIEEHLGIAIPEEHVNQNTTVKDLQSLIEKGNQVEQPLLRPNWPFKKTIRFIGNGLREVIIRFIIRYWVRIDVEGQKQLDNLDLPALFIFNHTDDFDGPIIYQVLPKRIRKRLTVATADDVLREHKFLAFIVRLCFAGFNLSRTEPYMPSLQYLCGLVDRGWCVVLSPEGRISKTGDLQPFKSGIGLLAVNLGIPVVPVKTIGLTGTLPLHAKWPKKHSRITVRIGQALNFNAHANYDEVTLKLHDIMESL